MGVTQSAPPKPRPVSTAYRNSRAVSQRIQRASRAFTHDGAATTWAESKPLQTVAADRHRSISKEHAEEQERLIQQTMNELMKDVPEQ